MQVLVVSGDPRLAGWLTETLAGVGWTVQTAGAPTDGHLPAGWNAQLLLTDVRPRVLEEPWTDDVRRAGAVLVVVTPRTVDGELEAALAAGADGFVQCPVGSHELVARLRAVVRRCADAPGRRPKVAAGTTVRVGSLSLDRRSGAIDLAGVPLHLQRSELEILEALMVAAPGVVSRDELSRTYLDGDTGTATLDVVVRRLRGRLELREGWRRIDTVRGVGFRLLDRPTAAPDVPEAFTSATVPGHEPFDLDRERVSP